MKGYGHKHINVNGLRMVIAMCTCDGIGYIIIHVIEFDKYQKKSSIQNLPTFLQMEESSNLWKGRAKQSDVYDMQPTFLLL